MTKKTYVLAGALSVLALAGLAGLSHTGPPDRTARLSPQDLRVAVGTACCNNVDTLAEVYCKKAQELCPTTSIIPTCTGGHWTNSCAEENGQKSSGTGTKTIHEVQCSGTYAHGKCKIVVDLCVQGDADASSPSTCGTKMTDGAC